MSDSETSFVQQDDDVDQLGDFNLIELFGLDRPATAGHVVPEPYDYEISSELAPRVPTSPGLCAEDFDAYNLDDSVSLDNIWGCYDANQNPQVYLRDFHPEVSCDLAGGLNETRPLSDKSNSTYNIKQELDGDCQQSSTISSSIVPSPKEQAASVKSKMIEVDGYKVTAPPNGKPLYTTPVDVHEETIQNIFPEWTLRLERNDFNRWKRKNKIRKLTPKESDRLRKYRRTMLARVYADRARHRRTAKHVDAEAALTKLQAENAALRARVAELEASHRDITQVRQPAPGLSAHSHPC